MLCSILHVFVFNLSLGHLADVDIAVHLGAPVRDEASVYSRSQLILQLPDDASDAHFVLIIAHLELSASVVVM